MSFLAIPTRGSDRVIRKDWIWPLAAHFDHVLILCRDWDFGDYAFPENVKVDYSDRTLPQRRQLGAEKAAEYGEKFFWQVDDDVVTKDWGALIYPMRQALERYEWLGSVETQSSPRDFYTRDLGNTSQYGDLITPNLQMRWSPSQMWAVRTKAFFETEGFFPFVTMEDIDLGLQLCEKGWLQACVMGPVFQLNRGKLDNSKRKGQGGMVPEERLRQTEQAVAWIREKHPNILKAVTVAWSKHGTPSQRIRLNWQNYADKAVLRWGLTESVRQVLATRIRQYRGEI